MAGRTTITDAMQVSSPMTATFPKLRTAEFTDCINAV
jgi:hypothetical protein